jgi:hypothetical protein
LPTARCEKPPSRPGAHLKRVDECGIGAINFNQEVFR